MNNDRIKLEDLIGKNIYIIYSFTNPIIHFKRQLKVLEIGEEIKEGIFKVKCLDPSVGDWDFTTNQWDWYELNISEYGQTWFSDDNYIKIKE